MQTPDIRDLRSKLDAAASAAGFDILRVTTPERIGTAGARLAEFLREGRHGDMAWMAANADRRADPRVLWPGVRSILMLGLNYTPARNPIAANVAPDRGVVSAYARGRDYHDIVKKGLHEVAGFVRTAAGGEVKVFVDTAPLMEKPLAESAGIGWQGKHTNLVSRHVGGSWLFLGAILTTAEIASDAPETDHCGSCSRCLTSCPTDAFPAPYQLDARRCIAYLTIEHKGHVDTEFRRAIGNRVFGCDDCLAVCPWNKFAEAARNQRIAARVENDSPPLADLLTLDNAAFRARFAGTPVKRTGRDRFIRNVLIAAGNSADASLTPIIIRLASDPSPLVRAMAAWALSQLVGSADFIRYRDRHIAGETNAEVRREWDGGAS